MPEWLRWLAYSVANATVFAVAVTRYRTEPGWIQVARGAGACLDLNAALILLTAMRGSFAWARRVLGMRLGARVAAAFEFHQSIGYVLVVMSVVHGLAHVANVRQHPRALLAPVMLTGVVLLAGILLVWLTSIRRHRSGAGFRRFLWVHVVALGWLGLTIVHSPRAWPWIVVPALGYAIDRTVRMLRGHPRQGVVRAEIVGGRLVELEIVRPRWFHYVPGDFVKLRIPAVSRREWHPFTITSDPSNRRTVSVHVRSRGDWTARLTQQLLQALPPRVVSLQGPFSAPANRVLSSRHAVMIAAGIGITPFAAVLSALVSGHPRGQLEQMQLFWVFRELDIFQPFQALCAAVMLERPWVDIQAYLTGPGERAVPWIQRRRPAWPEVFAQVAGAAQSPVHVFVCGASGSMLSEVRGLSRRHGFAYAQEIF